jgi:hypothetical protein
LHKLSCAVTLLALYIIKGILEFANILIY